MTNSVRRVAQAISKSPPKSPARAGLGQALKCYSATFVQTESVDVNLSKITIGNSTCRFVPRLSSAWTAAPGAGTTVLVASLGGSLIILCIQVGDTSKATYP